MILSAAGGADKMPTQDVSGCCPAESPANRSACKLVPLRADFSTPEGSRSHCPTDPRRRATRVTVRAACTSCRLSPGRTGRRQCTGATSTSFHVWPYVGRRDRHGDRALARLRRQTRGERARRPAPGRWVLPVDSECPAWCTSWAPGGPGRGRLGPLPRPCEGLRAIPPRRVPPVPAPPGRERDTAPLASPVAGLS
jgi:hypothetical protein